MSKNSENDSLLRYRPTGVTILGLLFIITGALSLFGGIATLIAIPFVAIFGALWIALGIASLVVAYGLFKGKSWAWYVAVVLSIIGVVVNVISLVTGNMGAITGALVGIAINAIVLYYLSRRNVRQYFGKVASAKQSPSATV
jgi:uncharacterized membrane protein (DUF2068 family)